MTNSLKGAIRVGVGSFFLAIIINTASQNLLSMVEFLPIAFLLLIFIILIGIIFDIIGVAVAVAEESTFHARAAKRIAGARQAIVLVRNADKVANFCADVVGDISGTLSGAISAAVIFKVFILGSTTHLWANTIVTALVAALTIGGKAWGKKFAIVEADEIIFQVGKILAFLESTSGISLIRTENKKGRKA